VQEEAQSLPVLTLASSTSSAAAGGGRVAEAMKPRRWPALCAVGRQAARGWEAGCALHAAGSQAARGWEAGRVLQGGRPHAVCCW
jgi:hypothetical protein